MKFIINADDFGLSSKVNKAIYESAKSKYISSSTIMAVAPKLEEAVEMSRELPDVSFGAHLVLDDDFNALSDHLGNFSSSEHIKFNRLNFNVLDIIVDEFSKQIEKLQNMGINLSHIDSHHHLHRYPVVALAMIRVAKKYDIKKLRSQHVMGAKLSFLNRNYRIIHHKLVQMSGLIQPTGYTDFDLVSHINTSHNDENSVCEVMCHPGSKYNDEAYFNDEFYSIFKNNIMNYNQLK